MISWFVLTLELSNRLQNTGQCIYSEWKMLENQSANLCLYVSLKEFSQSIFFLFRRRVSSSNCSFIVYRKHSLPTPFTPWTLTSHCTQPSHSHNNWANHEVRKKPAYHKRSHISLQLCWISERALVHSFADGLHKWFRQCVGRLQCRLCLPSSAPFWLSTN